MILGVISISYYPVGILAGEFHALARPAFIVCFALLLFYFIQLWS